MKKICLTFICLIGLLTPFVDASELTYPLSGLPAESQIETERRPLAVMLDNHPNARFQAGLSQADVVYEYQVEGPYTRYMAVFQSQQPEAIGPIRSARPYFVETASDLGAIYTHFGGSGEGNQKIADLKLNNIDGMKVAESVIWRFYDTGKEAPHNAYASYQSLSNFSQAQAYENESSVHPFEYNSEFTQPSGQPGQSVTIQFNGDNISQFDYKADSQTYAYTKDGSLQVDEYYQVGIEPTNIIVHKMDFQPLSASSGTYKVDLNGSGEAQYFTAGQSMTITWEKQEGQPFQYFDEAGQPLKLNPGMTWIALGKTDITVTAN